MIQTRTWVAYRHRDSGRYKVVRYVVTVKGHFSVVHDLPAPEAPRGEIVENMLVYPDEQIAYPSRRDAETARALRGVRFAETPAPAATLHRHADERVLYWDADTEIPTVRQRWDNPVVPDGVSLPKVPSRRAGHDG